MNKADRFGDALVEALSERPLRALSVIRLPVTDTSDPYISAYIPARPFPSMALLVTYT